MFFSKNKNSGITLIALIITIIILLILAGITISTIVGNNGILDKATNSADKTKIEDARERIAIEVMGSYDENGSLNMSFLKENLENNLGIDTSNIGNSLPTGTIILDGLNFYINENEEVILGTSSNEDNFPSIMIAFSGAGIYENNPTVTATITNIENENNINIEKTKWVYNTTQGQIGTDETKYPNNFNSIHEELVLNMDAPGTYYLHVLLTDNIGNMVESISKPVTLSENLHTHIGNESENGGCYTVPVYHTHTETCNGTCVQTVYSSRNLAGQGCYVGNDGGSRTEYSYNHSACGAPNGTFAVSFCSTHGTYGWAENGWPGSPTVGATDTHTYLTCGKTSTSIDKYDLGCNLQENQVISYTVSY